jgi:hypothetical protein
MKRIAAASSLALVPALLGLALALALALAGCARAGSGGEAKDLARKSAVDEAPASSQLEPEADRSVAASEPSSPSGGMAGSVSLPAARMVIKTASLSVRVQDVAAAHAKAVRLAEAGGGFVESSSEYQEGGGSAEVVIRVPPQRFLSLVSALEGLGKPESKSIGGQDVTEEYFDLSAELENQLEVRDRLFQLLRQAKKVEEAIAVEQQLERIGGNVNRIKGRMKYLQAMVGMSTVTLSLFTEERPDAEPFLNWRLVGHGFFRAAQVLVQALFVVLQVLVVAIPLLLIVGAAAWGVVLLVRLARARGLGRRAAKPQARR